MVTGRVRVRFRFRLRFRVRVSARFRVRVRVQRFLKDVFKDVVGAECWADLQMC